MCKRQQHLFALQPAQAFSCHISDVARGNLVTNQLVLFEAASFVSFCCKSLQLTAGSKANVLPDCGDCNNLFCPSWPDFLTGSIARTLLLLFQPELCIGTHDIDCQDVVTC